MWPFSSSKQNKNAVEAASYFSIKETTEEAEIEKMVSKLEQIFYSTSREIVILCIGSDRSTGDSLGPLAGKILKEKHSLSSIWDFAGACSRIEYQKGT